MIRTPRPGLIILCAAGALAFGLIGASAAGRTPVDRGASPAAQQAAAATSTPTAPPGGLAPFGCRVDATSSLCQTPPGLAPRTPTPVPTATPTSTPVRPHLEIDADTTNGTRPCDPVDATRLNAPISGSYTVAVCLVHSQGSPYAFELSVIWSGSAAAVPEVDDGGASLNDNPDFNDGAPPTGLGANWNCNGAGSFYPLADNPHTPSVTDARILCYEKTPASGGATAEPLLLATINVEAHGNGLEVFDLSRESNFEWSVAGGGAGICDSQSACPGAFVVQGSGPLITPTPSNTPTPFPIPTLSTPVVKPTISAPNRPHLAIDADTTNGSRPCDPVDAQRLNAPTSGAYTVGICLVNSQGSPDAFEAVVEWSGGVALAPEVADAGDALDDNPDFNDSTPPLGFGTDWNCTGLGFAYPIADDPQTPEVTEAHVVCNSKNFNAGELTAEPGLLATLTLQAGGTGFETFEFAPLYSAVNSPAGTNWLCWRDVSCPGAFVVQGDATPPTLTPTATPTVSNPCSAFSPPSPPGDPTECPTPPGGTAPFSIELSARPDEIICDGTHTSRILVKVRSALGSAVPDGTPVYFATSGRPALLGWRVATTSGGTADVEARALPLPQAPYSPFLVQVDVGRIEATIRVLCLPPAACVPCPRGCDPASPPQSVSPPCPTPVSCTQQSPPCVPPCDPFVSPPQSPPCEPPALSPPQCGGVLSPPCLTPSPCVPASSPPCVAPPPGCGATSPPCAPPAPPCADVNSDHRVTGQDVLLITRFMLAKRPNLKYDVNRDGRVDLLDVRFAFDQLGRRCLR